MLTYADVCAGDGLVYKTYGRWLPWRRVFNEYDFWEGYRNRPVKQLVNLVKLVNQLVKPVKQLVKLVKQLVELVKQLVKLVKPVKQLVRARFQRVLLLGGLPQQVDR